MIHDIRDIYAFLYPHLISYQLISDHKIITACYNPTQRNIFSSDILQPLTNYLYNSFPPERCETSNLENVPKTPNSIEQKHISTRSLTTVNSLLRVNQYLRRRIRQLAFKYECALGQ